MADTIGQYSLAIVAASFTAASVAWAACIVLQMVQDIRRGWKNG